MDVVLPSVDKSASQNYEVLVAVVDLCVYRSAPEVDLDVDVAQIGD